MNKKIVIVVNNSWYAWNMRANLGFALQKEGYEVVFIAPYDKYSENIKKYFKYINTNIDTKGTNPFSDLKIIYEYYKIFYEIKPNIILQYTIKPNIYGTIAANFLKIPTINNIAGLGTLFIKQNFVTKIAKFLYKFSQKRATKIFFQNQDDFKMFIDEKLVQKEKCDVLPGSGVDIEKFKPLEKEEDDGVFRFLLISRMLWAKGIQEFVDAAKIIKQKYKNVEFQLLGHLDVESPTAISKEQMDIWVKNGFVNYLGSSDDVRVEITQSDCIVLPSFYREGTPRILLESASMGKPIITTDNVGCKDVVDDGINGFLCEVKNADDLALKMEKMLNSSFDERNIMGKAGREKIVKEFDEKIVIEKYLKAIESILK
ncbi:glycosyltransferase family 4 protein [Aliarcobacter butzleri]|uniref:glycosyltransferase family 4 protein n=1 Tax=Aliarcobacter butzleri TaxID=28197 RepID=UPI0021B29E30|nr:glycosyltransferase family 4 protein [Aliarcobacter butzleri]MCT7572661.1 glycosyltransferase family 4 protein [Aliarcobacter butzleri]